MNNSIFTIDSHLHMIGDIIGKDKTVEPAGNRHSVRILVIGGTGSGKSCCIKSLAWMTKQRIDIEPIVISPGASSGSWIKPDNNPGYTNNEINPTKNHLFNKWVVPSVNQKLRGYSTLQTRDKMNDPINGAEFIGKLLFNKPSVDPKILILDDVIGNIGGRKTTDDRILNAVFTMTRQPGWRVFATIHPGASVQKNILENFTHLVVPKFTNPENLMCFSKIVGNCMYEDPNNIYKTLKELHRSYHLVNPKSGNYIDDHAVMIFKKEGSLISHGKIANKMKTNEMLLNDIVEGNSKELIRVNCLLDCVKQLKENSNSLQNNNYNQINNNVGVNNGEINNNIANFNITQQSIRNEAFIQKVDKLRYSYDHDDFEMLLEQCKEYSKMLLRYKCSADMEKKFCNYKKWYCKKNNLYSIRNISNTIVNKHSGINSSRTVKRIPTLTKMFKRHSDIQNSFIRKVKTCRDFESKLLYLKKLIFNVVFHMLYFFSDVDFKSAESRSNNFADDYIDFIIERKERVGGDNLRKIGSSLIGRLPGGMVGNVLFDSFMDYSDNVGLTNKLNKKVDKGVRGVGDALNYLMR